MQLIDTRVGVLAEGRLTVEFVGEGGELVAVRMATDDGSLDGDNAVRRAKEILVQLTAFETDAVAGVATSDIGSTGHPSEAQRDVGNTAPGLRG